MYINKQLAQDLADYIQLVNYQMDEMYEAISQKVPTENYNADLDNLMLEVEESSIKHLGNRHIKKWVDQHKRESEDPTRPVNPLNDVYGDFLNSLLPIVDEVTKDLKEALSTQEDTQEETYRPTEKAHYCNKVDQMGNGCRDSWHVGGNYGYNVCRNPNHHDNENENDPEKKLPDCPKCGRTLVAADWGIPEDWYCEVDGLYYWSQDLPGPRQTKFGNRSKPNPKKVVEDDGGGGGSGGDNLKPFTIDDYEMVMQWYDAKKHSDQLQGYCERVLELAEKIKDRLYKVYKDRL